MLRISSENVLEEFCFEGKGSYGRNQVAGYEAEAIE